MTRYLIYYESGAIYDITYDRAFAAIMSWAIGGTYKAL